MEKEVKSEPNQDSKDESSKANSHHKPSPEAKLLTGKVWKTALGLAIPMILFHLIEIMFVIIDKIMAVQLTTAEGGAYYQTGIDPAAAMSLFSPVLMLAAAVLVLFSAGGSVLYSMNIGRKKYDDARIAKSNSMLMAIYVSFAGILLAVVIGPLVLNFILGAHLGDPNAASWSLEENTLGNASYIYLLIYSLSFPVTALMGSLFSGLNAEGKVVVPSVISISSIPLNIVLNFFFMSPEFLGLGVGGAALATVIADTFILVFIFVYISQLKKKKATYLFAQKSDFVLRNDVVRKIASYGLPMTISMLMGALIAFVAFKGYIYIGTTPESEFNYLMDLGIDIDTTNSSLDLFLPIPSQPNGTPSQSVSFANSEQLANSEYYPMVTSYTTSVLLNSSNSYAAVNSFRRFVATGFVYGSMSLVSMNFGAKKFDRVKSAINFQLFFAITSLIIGTIIMHRYASWCINIVSNTWEQYENASIFVVHDPNMFRDTVINTYNILLIGGLFMSFEAIPYMLLSSTGHRTSSIVWNGIRGIILYFLLYWPLMFFITQSGNYNLALWTRPILEFIFFIYAMTYMIIFVKNIGNEKHFMYDQRIINRIVENRKIKTIPDALKLEGMYLETYGEKYRTKYDLHVSIINSKKDASSLDPNDPLYWQKLKEMHNKIQEQNKTEDAKQDQLTNKK